MASYSITLDTDDSGDNIFRIMDGLNEFKTLNYRPYEVRNIGGTHFAVYSEGVLAFQCRYTEITNPAGTTAQKYAALQDLFNVPTATSADIQAILTNIDANLNSLYSTTLDINNKDTNLETLRNTYQNDVYTDNALSSQINPTSSRKFYGFEFFNPNGQTAYIRLASALKGNRVFVLPPGQALYSAKSDVADFVDIDSIDLDKVDTFTYTGTSFTKTVTIILKY